MNKYYKVVTTNLCSPFYHDSITQYKLNEWVSSPSVDRPFFVFTNLEAAQKWKTAWCNNCFIYECEVDGIVQNHIATGVMTDPNMILVCKVKLKSSETVLKNGDVLSISHVMKVLVTCDYNYEHGKEDDRYKLTKLIILQSSCKKDIGEEWYPKIRNFKTIEDIEKTTKNRYVIKYLGNFNSVYSGK